jgi:hypothetical protein
VKNKSRDRFSTMPTLSNLYCRSGRSDRQRRINSGASTQQIKTLKNIF